MVQKMIDYRPCPTVEIPDNIYQVETAGFVPISVRFKQFTENGIISRLRAEQYDTDLPVSELENAFQMAEFDINDDDDIFTATEKITARNNYIAELKSSYFRPAAIKSFTFRWYAVSSRLKICCCKSF